MLLAIAAILFLLWVVAFATGTMLGGFVHFLLVISIAIVLMRLISGGGSIKR